MIAIHLTNDTITPALQEMANQARRPRALLAAAGGAARKTIITFLRSLDKSQPNKLGAKRSHFWNAMARTVHIANLTDRSVTIGIGDSRAAQKHFGGTIRAKRTKFLTIPVDPIAYNRTARTLEAEKGIKLFAFSKLGKGGLAAKLDGVFHVFYLFKKSVHQDPATPTGILPPDETLHAAIIPAAQAALSNDANPDPIASAAAEAAAMVDTYTTQFIITDAHRARLERAIILLDLYTRIGAVPDPIKSAGESALKELQDIRDNKFKGLPPSANVASAASFGNWGSNSRITAAT